MQSELDCNTDFSNHGQPTAGRSYTFDELVAATPGFEYVVAAARDYRRTRRRGDDDLEAWYSRFKPAVTQHFGWDSEPRQTGTPLDEFCCSHLAYDLVSDRLAAIVEGRR